MIRVLHIINGASMGGISSMILNYYRCMDRSKVHFDFVTSCENGYNGWELEKLGSKFYFIEMKSRGLWNHVKELDKLMKTEHFDAIHVHSNHTSYVALMVAWKNHIKVRIAHGHNAVKSKPSLKGRISRRVGIILIRIFSTKRLACSVDSAIYTFGKHSLNEKTMEVLPNAIDVEKFRYDPVKRIKYRKEFGLAEDTIVVGCVGRMSSEKNHRFLIELMPALIKKVPNIRLILIGDGDERISLANSAHQLGVEDHIVFAGERTNVYELLSLLDVFVLPSHNEGLGIVAVEAAAAGLPVIMSENVTDELGFIPNSIYIELSDKEKWVDQIVNLGTERKRASSEVAEMILKKNGYEIHTEAKKLEALYSIRGGVTSNPFVIGCVGRMSEEKNQQFLLHVFASVLNIKPDSVLILVGDGPEKSRLEELALTLKISGRVIFTGVRTDIPMLLNAFDVFVMPSIFEGFPIAGIEALSNGLPLVLSDTITRELDFTDYTTYISLQESYENWAKVICEQNEKRHMLSQADIVKDKGYDIYLSAKKLEQYYMG